MTDHPSLAGRRHLQLVPDRGPRSDTSFAVNLVFDDIPGLTPAGLTQIVGDLLGQLESEHGVAPSVVTVEQL